MDGKWFCRRLLKIFRSTRYIYTYWRTNDDFDEISNGLYYFILRRTASPQSTLLPVLCPFEIRFEIGNFCSLNASLTQTLESLLKCVFKSTFLCVLSVLSLELKLRRKNNFLMALCELRADRSCFSDFIHAKKRWNGSLECCYMLKYSKVIYDGENFNFNFNFSSRTFSVPGRVANRSGTLMRNFRFKRMHGRGLKVEPRPNHKKNLKVIASKKKHRIVY